MLLIDDTGAHRSISSLIKLIFSRIGFKLRVFISDLVNSRSFSNDLINFSKLHILWVSLGIKPAGCTVLADAHECWLNASEPIHWADSGSFGTSHCLVGELDMVFYRLTGDGERLPPPPGMTSLINSWTFWIDFSKSVKSTLSAI